MNGQTTAAIPTAATVHLVDVQRLLTLFSEGIGGRPRSIEIITGDPADRRKATAHRIDCITSDGQSIHLPESLSAYTDTHANLGAYRIAVLHQVGYDEFGTFDFRLATAVRRMPELAAAIAERPQSPTKYSEQPGKTITPAPLDIELFFETHVQPNLLKRIFSVIEGWRIDRKIRSCYPGARQDLDRAMTLALTQRPTRLSAGLPVLSQCLEALTRLTLGQDARQLQGSQPCSLLISELLKLTDQLSDSADVYDSAAISVQCCDALIGQLREATTMAEPTDESLDTIETDEALADPDATDGQPIDYRGDPFSMPAINKRRAAAQELADTDNNEYIDTDQQSGGEDSDKKAKPPTFAVTPHAPAADGERHILVDEWDYLQQRYRKGWCTVVEYQLHGDPGTFHRDLMNRHRDSFARTKRQFNAIRPEAIRRERRQPDGEEIELDRLIEQLVDRRAGFNGDDRLYMQRQRAQRDVAAAFLLDMSASTDFPVPESDSNAAPAAATADQSADDIGWAPLMRGSEPIPQPTVKRRVIDVARESLALMSTALETLGDRYAIYGFSGQGRHWVSFGVAKKFNDRCSPRTWGALAAIGPQGSTRMGAAVRHTTEQLRRERSRLKVLIIVSDGYPQDLDYGPDRGNDEYGLQDTAMALLEAKRLGIETFCLTVDPAGNDYLRRMCPDQRYLVIDEVNALPTELGKVYRALTTRAAR